MKIAEYNEMMAYLTRPEPQPTINRDNFAIGGGLFQGHDLGTREGFSSYTKKLVTPKFLNQSQTKFQDLTPLQQKLFNEGDLYVARVKTEYDPKTKTHKLKNVFGDSNKIDILLGDVIPDDLTNLPEELSPRGVAATKIRQKFIKNYLENLSEGEVINLDATVRKLNEKIQEATNGKISITDKKILMDSLADENINPNKVRAPKDLKEAKSIQFKEYDVSEEVINNRAAELNKKYGLEDKGISFRAKPTSTGKQTMMLEFSGGPFINKYKNKTVPFTEQGISQLEEILEPITKTKEFKNYSALEAKRQGSIKAGKTKSITYNQPELFEYLLNQEGPISKEQVIKDFKEFGYDEGTLRKAVGNLHANMYRALDPNQPGNGKFLSENYNSNEIKNVLNKVKNNFPGDFYNRTFEDLLVDAYGEDAKKYKPLADKLKKFRELQKKLRDSGVGKEFLAQLDHVIPFNFLQQVRAGKDPSELLRVKAYPGTLNSMAFKGTLDKRLGEAVEKGDKELIKTINELRSFLPEDMGQISSTGKRVVDYGAKPFNLKTMYTEQQAKFGEVYERTQKFLDNPKVQKLLNNAGISFKAIRDIKRLNVPGFIDTFNKILKQNPDLRVELQDPFSEIENQYASASMMSDVSPVKKEAKEGLPYEAALPTAVAAGKYTPQLLKILGNLGKVGIKTIGSPTVGLYYSGKELKGEDPNLALAGAEMLLPEIGKAVSTGPGAKGRLAAAGRFALNPFQALEKLGKYGKIGRAVAMGARIPSLMTPVGLGLMGIEGIRAAMREQDRINTMRETDPEAYEQYIADQEEMLRQSAAYGGRIGFADGPEDPSKRKFMKIMGGLGSLPIVGRFFDIAQVAEKAAPAALEAAKGMPAWFSGLVNKVIETGADVTKQFAKEKGEQVFVKQLGEAEGVRVTKNLETGKVTVDYDSPTNMGEDTVTFTYRPGTKTEKGENIPAQFEASELEPRGIRMGPDDYDIEFNGEHLVEDINFLESDTSSLKQFATGKLDEKDLKLREEKVKRVENINNDQVAQAEYLETKYGPSADDFNDYDLNYQDYSDYD